MTHSEIERQDIVDAYLNRRLSEGDRQAFEEHIFACDECFAQVQMAEKFAGGIRQAVESGDLRAPPEPDRDFFTGWLRPAFALSAAVAVILLAVTGWLTFGELPRLRRQIDNARYLAEEQRRRGLELEKLLAANRPPAAEANLPLVMLEASRAALAIEVTVPRGASRIVLWMEIAPAAGSGPFRLEIRSAAGQPVETLEGLVRNGYGALTASLPADRLNAGMYQARLFRIEGSRATLAADYRLQVHR
jgi:anti-sigma factor RsiW